MRKQVGTLSSFALMLRIFLYLWKRQETVTMQEILMDLAIPKNTGHEAVFIARNIGIIKGTNGVGGGYAACINPKDVNLSDLMKKTLIPPKQLAALPVLDSFYQNIDDITLEDIAQLL